MEFNTMKRAKYLIAFTALTVAFTVLADEKRNKNGSDSGNSICIGNICFEGFGNGSGFNPSSNNRVSNTDAFQAGDSGFSITDLNRASGGGWKPPVSNGGGGGIRPIMQRGNGDGWKPPTD